MNAMSESASSTHPDLILKRIYQAPRELVWTAITEPGHLAAWFGPHGFDNKSANVELRPGGDYSVLMAGPGGREFNAAYTISEVSPPEKLVMVTEQGDHESENFHRVRLLFELTENNAQTTLTLTAEVLEAEAKATGPLAGTDWAWAQSMERLAGTIGCLVLDLPDDRPATIITRIFEAPRELMWEAMTDAEHLQHWWGPNGMTNIVCEIDARPGGKWRVHQRVDSDQSPGGSPKGAVFKFRGEVREVVPPEKIVQTFGMEGMYEDQTIVETMTLTDLGNGKTLLKVVSVFEDIDEATAFAARKGLIDSGMSYGANETYQRLEAYLGEMEIGG